MAIDTREKRASLVGILPFLSVGVTPNASKDQEWRQEAGWGYPGIAATGGGGASVVGTVFRSALIKAACLLLALALPAQAQLPTPAMRAALPQLASHKSGQLELRFTAPGTYGNVGQHEVLMSFIDPENAREWKLAAATKYAPLVMSPPDSNRNFTREYGWELPWAFSIYQDVLTPDERAAYTAGLKAWVEKIISYGTWGPETRLEDSDVVIGHIPFIHGVDLALGTNYRNLNPDELIPGTGTMVGVSYGQMRAKQREIMQLAKGGPMPTSSGYMLGDWQLAIIGSAACGLDNYPEVTERLPDLAEWLQWELTPDKQERLDWTAVVSKERLEWGDVEGPHSLHAHALLPLMYMVIGLGGDKDGKLLQLAASLELPENLAWATQYRALLCFDPRTLPAKPAYEAPTGLRVTRDHAIYRSADTLFHVFAAASTGLDHEQRQPEVKLWHKGNWILDSPRGYQPWPKNQNASLAFGMPQMTERGLKSADAIDGGCKVVLESKGQWYYQPYYEPPPSFVDSLRTTLTLIPGKLTRHVRLEGREPTRLDRYYAHDRATLESSPALQQLWHAPPGSTPAPIDGGFSWLAKGGLPLTLTSNRSPRIEQALIGTNIGSYLEPTEEGGWIVSFDHDELPAEIDSVLRWDQPAPPPPTPNPTDVPIKGVIRGKQLIIELP